MFQKVDDARFITGEHEVLRFWLDHDIFAALKRKNAGKPKWSFLDGPITANNPMGVHHAWGRTYKDCYQRYFAMTGHELRYQNGFDCQGLWVEVEVEKELALGTKKAILDYGVDRFVHECKKRVLRFAARQTEQSVRLGYWMEWDHPDELRKLAAHIGTDDEVTLRTPRGQEVTGKSEELVARLGNPEWGGSYFTFATENNETIWTFLKKCFERKKVYRGHDVMPWSGRGGSAYSQMEIADGRKLTVHRSCFVRFPLLERENEYLLVWTTTPWTLTSNVAAAVNPELEYVKLRSKRDDAIYYFAKDNLEFKRLEREFKEGFGRPEWSWPPEVPKLKSLAQMFKEQGGYEIVETIKGADMVGWQYRGPFDELEAQQFCVSETARERLKSRIRSTSQLNEAAIAVLRRRAKEDLQQIRDYSESTELHEQWSAVSVARSNCEKFFKTVDGIVRNLGVEPWTPIDKHSDSEAAQKVIQNLLDLGIDCALTQCWRDDLEMFNAFLGEEQKSIEVSQIVPFIECQEELVREVYEGLTRLGEKPSRDSHRVIRGGTDSKGSPHVVAGEGTGIVHIAPGCGDVDHKIGERLWLPTIAPLGEDGTYGEGFGPFTGKAAIASETADLVFESLKEKDLLVYVEQYPHIYPHCWRTGDELVFRLVDEWFINMDWRDEIKDVTRAIDWVPDSIQGEERELEWLTTMRDWMISKKRFWGLALPIWINPDDPGDFEVIGSLAELKERAVEGWDEFEGHTPHKPWIDKVRIRSAKTGAVLERIPDVGNPWLDAGIVPFSTMMYNHDRQAWQEWYPADFVTECFPGQFRNWFYSMLALATMMRYDETDDPQEKRPFKTLLGHRLVMNEEGQPMHKSDGTAIWFEEAAEQLGVDTLRWLYLAQNPATDLRFGLRHPDEPVTLQTPDGPATETKEGLPCCKVTSKPADEIRRQILIPLWNSYAFFVNYAILDEFDPRQERVPVADRPEIDRWILSNLQALIATCRKECEAFNVAEACRAAAAFIDDLSNWYIRRNRRRFWRAGAAADRDTDKLAAYQTLYDVLVTLTKLLAPMIPFLTERMYGNLVTSLGGDEPESVHLCDYPEPDESLLDVSLNHRMATAQRVVRLGHRLREDSGHRVRQPLAELRFACPTPEATAEIEALKGVIADELNVKQIVPADNLDDLVSYVYKPNLKTLGPKYGKLLGVIRKQLPDVDAQTLAPLRSEQSVTLTLDGNEITLAPDDVLVSTEQASDWASGSDEGIQIALSTALTPELVREGMARDLIRHVQQLRKDADLDENARIRIIWANEAEDAGQLLAALAEWDETIRTETRADAVGRLDTAPEGGRTVSVGPEKVTVAIDG